MKRGAFSSSYTLASSTASLIAIGAAISPDVISYAPTLRMAMVIFERRVSFQPRRQASISPSSVSRFSRTPKYSFFR